MVGPLKKDFFAASLTSCRKETCVVLHKLDCNLSYLCSITNNRFEPWATLRPKSYIIEKWVFEWILPWIKEDVKIKHSTGNRRNLSPFKRFIQCASHCFPIINYWVKVKLARAWNLIMPAFSLGTQCGGLGSKTFFFELSSKSEEKRVQKSTNLLAAYISNCKLHYL